MIPNTTGKYLATSVLLRIYKLQFYLHSETMTKNNTNACINSYMCLVRENDKVNLVTQRNYDKNVRNSCMICVSEFTLASCGSEMVVASFRGREFYDFRIYRGGQRFAHKNSKMQFLGNKYAVWFYKSYQNEKRFLKL